MQIHETSRLIIPYAGGFRRGCLWLREGLFEPQSCLRLRVVVAGAVSVFLLVIFYLQN